jgi:hypothetical protein
MVTEPPKTAPPVSQPGRDRSPPFPFISLRAAVERVVALDTTFGRHAAPVDKLGLAWKMKEKSSQALQTAAALKAFGLVDYTGKTENRTVSISEDGRTYLRAQQDSTKAEVLKRCALKPKAISMCWQRWGADRPPDAVCLDQLILKDKFTDSAAHTLLRVYDETVVFARLANGDTTQSPDEAQDEEPTEAMDKQQAGMQPVVQAARPPGQPNVSASAGLTPAVSSHDDKYELGDGRSFILRWPTTVSAAEFEEFEAWIALLQKKLKRSVQQ